MADATHKELKTAVDEMATAFEQFKQYHDETLDGLVKRDDVDTLVKQAEEKADQAVQQAIERVEKLEREKRGLEAAIKRGAGVAGADVARLDPEERAKAFNLYSGGKADGEALTAYKRAFVELMRRGDAVDPDVQKALQVGRDSDGGYWVEPDTTGRMVQRVFETSPVRQVAAVQTISTDALTGPLDLDELDSGWVGETQARTATGTPQIGEWRIPVHEVYAFPLTTQKLLDDAAVDVEGWLERKLGSKFGRREGEAFVKGNGVKRPRGFLTYAAGVPDASDWERIERIQTGVDGDFPAVDPDNHGMPGDVLVETMFRLKEEYRTNATWAMNRRVEAAIRKFKDANGNYIWSPDLQARTGRMLLGAAIINFEDMPDIASGSLSIAVADWEEAYQIVDRVGVRILRDPYTHKPFVGFYATRRVGGGVINTDAIKLVEFDA